MCGRPIAAVDIASRVDFSPSFTDYPAVGMSGFLCGWCKTTSAQGVNRELQRAVATGAGVFSLNKDEHRTWFLLTPPEPPFVAVVSTSKNFFVAMHLHWRTPVTLDKRLLYVRVGDKVYQIRHPLLLQAIEWSKEVADAVQARRPAAKRKVSLNHPFVLLERTADRAGHGVLLPEAIALRDDPALAPAIHGLRHLGAGELWALATLSKAQPVPPVCPEPVTSVA
jgi:CRISPR type IV-associated protein Csf1